MTDFQEKLKEFIRLFWYNRPIKGNYIEYYYNERDNEIYEQTLPIAEYIDGISQIHHLLNLPYDQKVVKNFGGKDYFMVANLNCGIGLVFDRCTEESFIFQIWEDDGVWGIEEYYKTPLGKDNKEWWKNNLISLISNTTFPYSNYPYQKLIEEIWNFNFSNKITYKR